MIEITEQDIDPEKVISNLRRENVGAIVSFIGTVRGFADRPGEDNQVEVKELQYECYKDMALEKMEEIRVHALNNYEIYKMHILHRTGVLKPKDQIVLVAVSAPHRKDAFMACEFAIEELKKSVPIWKKEVTKEREYWVGSEGN